MFAYRSQQKHMQMKKEVNNEMKVIENWFWRFLVQLEDTFQYAGSLRNGSSKKIYLRKYFNIYRLEIHVVALFLTFIHNYLVILFVPFCRTESSLLTSFLFQILINLYVIQLTETHPSPLINLVIFEFLHKLTLIADLFSHNYSTVFS